MRVKILFLTHSLGGGGAERVLVNLVNHMDKTKFDITVKTLFSDGVNRKMLSDDVKYECRHAPCFHGITYLYKLIPSTILYKYFVGNEHYDIIVAYMHGIPTKVVCGCKDKSVKKVSWLHYGNPKESSFFDCWMSKKKSIRDYASLSAIVGVSQSVTEAFQKYTEIVHNTIVLYNTNDTNRILEMAKEKPAFPFEKSIRTLCSAGRLETQKGYDRLIKAAKKLHDEGLSFKIIILGDGSQKTALAEQINEADASSYIQLLGFCENPYSIMAASDAFISSSREEGLATVLTEALTLGLPIVSTDVSGAKEVLGNNNEYGLVVENSEKGIYNGLKEILTNQNLMERYRKTAKVRAKQFDTEHTVQKTEEFFEGLMKN